MKPRCLLTLFATVLLNSLAFAEKAPLSVRALQEQADAVVVATLEQIRIESEPSYFEHGFGNSDWGIYLKLRLETVEKGDVSASQLEARCFRIRYRRSRLEYLTPSGHHPIPPTGTRARVYLERDDGSWLVVLPNGIEPIGSDVPDALEVTQLRSRVFTYFLPLELWGLLIAVGILVLTGLTFIVRWYKRRHQPPASEPSPAPAAR